MANLDVRRPWVSNGPMLAMSICHSRPINKTRHGPAIPPTLLSTGAAGWRVECRETRAYGWAIRDPD